MTSDSNNKNFDKDEWVQLLQWIKDGIAKDYINHHYYNEFQKIKYIGSGGHCKVYRATWKNRDTVVALKSFEINDYVMKEMVNEVKLLNKVNFHKNIIQFFALLKEKIG